MADRRPELALVLALLIAAPLLFLIPINHDSYWTLWLARQMRHGVPLYSQLIETNPPLWFWMAVPIEVVAEAVHISPIRALVLMFILVLGLSFWLSTQLADEDRGRLYLSVFVATVLLPLSTFTQREHFVLIASIPYVLLAARRAKGKRVPWSIAVATGLISATGFALKPFFLIVPAALALWSRSLRLEAVIVAAFISAYAVAILLLAPAYVTIIVPLERQAYGGFGGMTEIVALFSLMPIVLAAPLVSGASTTGRTFLVAALAFYLALLAQGKGWGYHALPAYGLLLIALGLSPWGRSWWRDALAATSLATMAFPRMGLYRNDASHLLASRIHLPAHSTIAVLSRSAMPAWPFVEEEHYRWPLRLNVLWMLHAAASNRALLQDINSAVAHDLACNPPRLLIVDEDADLPIVSSFRETGTIGRYRVMIPRSEFRRPRQCRRVY